MYLNVHVADYSSTAVGLHGIKQRMAKLYGVWLGFQNNETDTSVESLYYATNLLQARF